MVISQATPSRPQRLRLHQQHKHMRWGGSGTSTACSHPLLVVPPPSLLIAANAGTTQLTIREAAEAKQARMSNPPVTCHYSPPRRGHVALQRAAPPHTGAHRACNEASARETRRADSSHPPSIPPSPPEPPLPTLTNVKFNL